MFENLKTKSPEEAVAKMRRIIDQQDPKRQRELNELLRKLHNLWLKHSYDLFEMMELLYAETYQLHPPREASKPDLDSILQALADATGCEVEVINLDELLEEEGPKPH